MELSEIRKEIDAIDAQLLPLFIRRMDCAKKVAEVKRRDGTPVFNLEREQEILNRIAAQAGEYGGAARIVYNTIMSESRALQHTLLGAGSRLRTRIAAAPEAPRRTAAIACLGGKGSYSHDVVSQLYPQAVPSFFSRFGDIFRCVEQGEADLAVIPVENSSAGSVSEVYGLLMQYCFSIIAAKTLGVHHCLANRTGKFEDIRCVRSKDIALMQCSQRLAALQVPLSDSSSTSAAAELAARDAGVAAVCSESAAKAHGLHILERDIQNTDNNATRFVVISKELCIPRTAEKISLCFNVPHTTGSLNAVLSRFAAAGMNLTKIESRPIAGKTFEYDFYLDFTGNVHDPKVLELLCSLEDELPRFHFLGNYCECK
ncbi:MULTISPECIES: bifunctional chorismate mutase/prephenate dehydratase [Caproicibacterium]|uniref:Bifunctional chorismate mutase/prephenate dehydratase n=1 Tax=Caproicibacterium argilliputei TaxID=3030016 RepID=A0AA97D972_9FIRM|nr:bifunctional chorismate mutase/prephenate dehydratase [Caproicibacterium argilliputei]WOC32569.1 prephenate dehydratase domain-containing protein [Caproicibacterium argilliputei]